MSIGIDEIPRTGPPDRAALDGMRDSQGTREDTPEKGSRAVLLATLRRLLRNRDRIQR